jgi:hypothetical protein
MGRSKKKAAKSIPRNPLAVHAKSRTAGKAPMKHRLEPKKGASNDQPELLHEAEQVKLACSRCGQEVLADWQVGRCYVEEDEPAEMDEHAEAEPWEKVWG